MISLTVRITPITRASVIVIATIAMTDCITTDRGNVGAFQSIARRSEWRRELGWTDTCERAFRQTHGSDDARSGVRVVPLSSGWRVVEVQCAAGAYQPSQLFVGISP